MSAAVGVIVPVRAPAPYLAEALDSALTQQPPPAEVVVVDDASAEPIVLADAHAERCRLTRRPSRGGPAAARATALAELASPLVALLDADDAWEPGKLAAQLEVMDRHPEVALCFGRATVVGPDGGPTGEAPPAVAEGLLEAAYMARLLFEVNPIPTSSTLLRREALERSGGFGRDLESDDLGCWMRVAEGGGHFFLEPRARVRYRRHAGGWSYDIRVGARIALAVHDAHGAALDPETRGRLRRDFLCLLARGEIRKRRYPEARRALREAARAAPLGRRERALGVAAAVPGLRAALGRRDPHAGP